MLGIEPNQTFITSLKNQLCSWLKIKTLAISDLVGLDISVDCVRLLKFKRSKSELLVENFAVVPLAEGIIVKDEIKNLTALSATVRDLFLKARPLSNQIALSLPRSKVVIKTISLDKRLTPEELESRAWIEVNRHFPDLIGDIYFDFFTTNLSGQDTPQYELTLVACRKSQVKSYLDLMQMAKLNARIIDVDSYALERCLKLLVPDDQSTIGLLDLGLDMSMLVVVSHGALIYAHDQSYDGQRLKKQAMAYLAENPGTEGLAASRLEDAQYQTILHEGLLAHLRHTMQFFYTSRPHVRIDKLMVSGDLATLPNLHEFIHKETGIDTQLIDLVPKLTFSSPELKETFIQQGPTLALVCGLALTDGTIT